MRDKILILLQFDNIIYNGKFHEILWIQRVAKLKQFPLDPKWERLAKGAAAYQRKGGFYRAAILHSRNDTGY